MKKCLLRRSLIVSALFLSGLVRPAAAAWQTGLLGGYATRTSNTHDMTVEPANTNVWPFTSAATNNTVLWASNRCWIYWGQVYLPTGNWSIASFNDDTCYIYVDGELIHSQASYGALYTADAVSITKAGWFDLVVRMGNGTGGAGPVSTALANMGGSFGFTSMPNPPQSITSDYTFPDGTGEILFRYDDGLGFDDSFTIVGVPADIGEPDPDYGTYDGVANGSNLTMSVASGTEVITVGDGQRACCTGYVWYAVNGATWEKTLVAAEAETAFGYTHSNMAEITWLWCVSNRTVVTATAGGSVAANGVSGTSMTNWGDSLTGRLDIAAVPAAEHVFYQWTGDIADDQKLSPTISVDYSQARTITANFGSIIFADAALGTDDESHGHAPGVDAYKSLTNAVAHAVDGDTIYLADGTYKQSSELIIGTDIHIIGNNAFPTNVILARAGVNVMRIVSVIGGATLSGLTIQDGWGNADVEGAGAYISNGTITNCVIRNNNCSGMSTKGGGVQVNGANALLIDSEIYNNKHDNSGPGGGGIIAFEGTIVGCSIHHNWSRTRGGGIYCGGTGTKIVEFTDCDIYENNAGRSVSSGGGWTVGPGCGIYASTRANCIVRRSRIHNNYWTHNYNGHDFRGAGVYNATLYDSLIVSNYCAAALGYPDSQFGGGCYNCVAYNCTIMHNRSHNGGGVYAGTYVNCIIVENSDNSSESEGGDCSTANYAGDAVLSYCCGTPLASGEGNIAVDPVVDVAADYILGESPCYNAGNTSTVDPSRSTVDFAGRERVQFGVVDMGCHEKTNAPTLVLTLTAFALPPQEEGSLLSAYRFDAAIAPADPLAEYAWDFGAGETSVGAEGASVTHQFVGAPSNRTVTVTVNSNGAERETSLEVFVGTFASDLYVSSPDNVVNPGSDENCGDAEHPFATILKAVAVVAEISEGCTVHIADGDYPISSRILLTKPISLVGTSGHRENVIIRRQAGDMGLVTETSPTPVTISGITFQDGSVNIGNSAGLTLGNATLSNCVVRLCKTGSEQTESTVVLKGAGCTVVDCNIYSNYHGYSSGAIKVSAGNARILRTDIHHNNSRSSCAAVYITGGTALFEECNIYSNRVDTWGWSGTGNGNGPCIYGNGAANTVFRRCRVYGNTDRKERNTQSSYGGFYNLSAYDCLFLDNHWYAPTESCPNKVSQGVLRSCVLVNCTIVGNESYLGAIYYCQAKNCIVWDNICAEGAVMNYTSSTTYKLDYCCTTPPVPTGHGANNIADAPGFKLRSAHPYMLSITSKCRDGGSNALYTNELTGNELDFAGQPRVFHNVIDIGCYENQQTPSSLIWLR